MRNYLSNKLFLLFVFSVCAVFVHAVETIWPIEGKKSGDGILYKPGDYVGSYKIFDDLIISAPEGTKVLSPVDGKISSISYIYRKSFIQSTSYNIPNLNSADISEFDRKFRKSITEGTDLNDQYVSLSISISCGQGEVYWISGLRPVKIFKTGYSIRKGEVIGTVGFFINQIPESCICLSKSLYSKPADPMSPFGLITSFVPPKPVEVKKEIPVSELIEDFEIFRNALVEGHPGLYDYTSQSNMNSTFESIRGNLNKSMSSVKFGELLLPVLDSLRDSHTALFNFYGQPEQNKRNKYFGLPIRYGFQNDSLIIYQAFQKYINLLNKSIIRINNEDVNLIRQGISFKNHFQEGFNNEREKISFFGAFQDRIKTIRNHKSGDSILFTFSDNTEASFKYFDFVGNEEYIPDRVKIKDTIYNNFILKRLDSATNYLKFNSFALSQVDEDSLRNVMKSICNSSCSNLIIDVRDNPGGNDSYCRLFSMMVQKPFRANVSSMVKSNGQYKFLKNAPSYFSIDTVKLFSNYKKIEGKEGFYVNGGELYLPNDSINYKGKVFVLVNEKSISSATLFPALVHKHKRGIIIGRETGSCYYQMNADKFVTVHLPNSKMDLHMPLVKLIFDDMMDPEIPWGHGVIPDYYVGFNAKEYLYKSDPILDFALNLIKQSESGN